MFVQNNTSDIADLRSKVKEQRSPAFDFVTADTLVVWQCKESGLFTDMEESQLEELIDIINFSDKAKAIQLGSSTTIVDLKLSDKELLLVQVPSAFPASILLFSSESIS